MVSFSCESCNDTVIKKKLAQHKQRCRDAAFTCIDCSVTFYDGGWNSHTSCISEAQKYEKALYKPKPVKTKAEPKAAAKPEPKEQPKKESKEPKKESKPKKEKEPKKDSKKAEPESPSDLLAQLQSHLKAKPKPFKKTLKKLAKADQKKLLAALQVSLQDGQVVLHM